MGYSTNFTGTLTFTDTITIPMLQMVKQFMGADCRSHPEWNRTDLTYIDLEINDDMTGLEWNGSEKTYDLVEKVNLIIEQVQKVYPTFGLTGSLKAQGEDYEDRWVLIIEDGKAIRKENPKVGTRITCPCCGDKFILEEEEAYTSFVQK